jgi:hypothetical protein
MVNSLFHVLVVVASSLGIQFQVYSDYLFEPTRVNEWIISPNAAFVLAWKIRNLKKPNLR